MDPFRLVARALFAYVLLLVVIRLTGQRTVKHGSVLDFTVALVLGDLVDDLVWAEVPISQFVVAVAALLMSHLALDILRFKSRVASVKSHS